MTRGWWRRYASASLCSTGWCGVQVHSFRRVWECVEQWNDLPDLPSLSSIRIGNSALRGRNDDYYDDYDQPISKDKNPLIMRSGLERSSSSTDLPNLTSFKGKGLNFQNIGPVTLESNDCGVCWHRYPESHIQLHRVQRGVLRDVSGDDGDKSSFLFLPIH